MDHPASGEANVFEMLLPPQAVPLLGVLLLMIPLTLLAGESLFVPLFESVKSLLIPEMEAMQTHLPTHFYVKLAAFCFLTFFGVIQMILRIRLCYYQAWAKAFSRPDPLHVDYQPDPQQSMLAVLNWNMFRWFMILVPPLLIGAITIGVGFLELYLFNMFVDMPAMSLPAMIVSFLFITLLLSLFSLFSVFNSIWIALITLFGEVAAITEPDLAAKTIYDRCRRIAFASPFVYLLYPAYVLFLLLVVTEIGWLLMAYDVQDLVHFRLNLPLILGLEIGTLAVYLGLNFLKFFTYHDALSRYYRKLPGPFRERFTEPPAPRAEA